MEWLKFLLLLFMLWRHFFCTFQDIKIYLLSQKSCVFCIVHHDTVTCLFTCQTLTVAEIQAYVKMVVLVSTLTLISSGVIANLALLVTSAKLVSTATNVKMEETSIKQSMSQSVNQSMRLSGWGQLWLEHILCHGPSWDSIGFQGSYNGCNVFSIIAFCGTTNLDTTSLGNQSEKLQNSPKLVLQRCLQKCAPIWWRLIEMAGIPWYIAPLKRCIFHETLGC